VRSVIRSLALRDFVQQGGRFFVQEPTGETEVVRTVFPSLSLRPSVQEDGLVFEQMEAKDAKMRSIPDFARFRHHFTFSRDLHAKS
jgi:hypothetical protein